MNRPHGFFIRAIRSLGEVPAGAIGGLDLLRALAIALVFSGHFAESFATRLGVAAPGARFPLFYFGWTGVDLFFVLSGYLIGRQLWKELRETGHIRIGRFLLRRGLRIWPLYFSTLAFFAFVLQRQGTDGWALLPDLFCVSNYSSGVISGGWSLSTEEQFYLVVPGLLLLTARFFKGKTAARAQWLVPAGLLVLLPVSRLLTLRRHPDLEGVATLPPDLLYTPFHTHCDGLLVGLVLAGLSVAAPALLERRRLRDNLLLPAGLLAAGVLLRRFDKSLFAFSALGLIYGGLVLFVLRDGSGFSRLTRWRGFHLVSRLSYGMYLNHLEIFPHGVIWLGTWLRPRLGEGTLLFTAIYLACFLASLLIAAITFSLIEYPFLELRDRWLSGWIPVRREPLASREVA